MNLKELAYINIKKNNIFEFFIKKIFIFHYKKTLNNFWFINAIERFLFLNINKNNLPKTNF